MNRESYIITYTDNLNPTFGREFFAYRQEPKEPYETSEEKIKITGWILQRNDPKEIKILAVSNDLEYQSTISTSRRDVIERYGQSNQLFSEQELCGFELYIPRTQNLQSIDIFVIKDNSRHSWFSLIASSEITKLKKAKATWQRYCSSQLNEIDESDIDAFEKISINEKKSIIMASVNIAYNAEQLIAHAKVEPEQCNATHNFFSFIHNHDCITSTIESAVKDNKITITSPLGHGKAYCSESFVFEQNITILKFTNYDKEVFYIFQSVSFFDAIYFPLRQVYVSLREIDASSARNYLCAALGDFRKIINYATQADRNKFHGLITGHSRPYHYFYNHLPGLEKLSETGLLSRIENFTYFPGCDFINLKDVFPEIEGKVTIAHPQIMTELIGNNNFSCQVGLNFISHDKSAIDIVDKLDLKLKKTPKAIPLNKVFTTPSIHNKLSSLSNFFPIVWFGVMSQKRSWIEQVPAAIEILNELENSFPSIAVVFDGWTNPITSTATDQIQIENDLAITKEITKSLKKNISIFNVVGATALEKIYVANHIDCFIGNASAGIIFTDRIAKRAGIGHLNKEMLKAPLYLHRKVTLVPEDKITDAQHQNISRADYISYHINPETVKELVKTTLIEASVKQRLFDNN